MQNTNEIPTLFMLVGLPGSGKSTYAEKLSKRENAVILSSDTIREKYFGEINNQDNNTEVFKILHNMIKDNLLIGKNVIYDATNISSKRRKSFIEEQLHSIPCIKTCIIIATPYEECLTNNNKRERHVPEYSIKQMYMNFHTPYYFEGWDNIYIHDNNKNREKLNPVDFANHVDLPHDNPHHLETLKEHTLSVHSYIAYDKTYSDIALLHDLGKPFTKTFINSKGEKTDIAHYYKHENVGAYDSLFYNTNEPLFTSVVINLHMLPFDWEKSDKQEQLENKFRKLWGIPLFYSVMNLHKADKLSSRIKEIELIR